MRDNDWTRVVGVQGYKVFRHEIDEGTKRLKLWFLRKRANKQLVCSGCGKLVGDIIESYALSPSFLIGSSANVGNTFQEGGFGPKWV
jgi:hypothetical protein